MEKIIKTVSDGRQLKITDEAITLGDTVIHNYIRYAYSHIVAIAPTKINGTEYHHRIGQVALTHDERQALIDAMLMTHDGLHIVYDELAAQRQRLVEQVSDARIAYADHHEQAIYRAMSGGGYNHDEDADKAAITAAQKELANYDAEYPQIAEEMIRRRAKELRKYVDNN